MQLTPIALAMLLVLGLAVDLGMGQFFVDVEHALPRIGKSAPPSSADESSSELAFSVNSVADKLVNDEKGLYFLNKAIDYFNTRIKRARQQQQQQQQQQQMNYY